MKKLFFGSIALALLAGPAVAADMPVKAAPPPVYSWTGLYLGINGGYAWGQTSTTLLPFNTPGSPAFFNGANLAGVSAAGSNTFNNNSAIFGGQIGYMIQGGPAVMGIELGVDSMRLKGAISNTQLYTVAIPNNGFTINEGVSSNWLVTFLVRAGYDLGGFVPYVTGGVAFTDLTYNFNYIDATFAPGCPCAASFTQVIGTAAVGAGIEVLLAQHWSLRAEYLYMNFSGLSATSFVLGAPPLSAVGSSATLIHSVSVKENIARGLVSYKF
jgi:outer membrane immunogenic protein